MIHEVYFYNNKGTEIAMTDGLSEKVCRKIQPQLKRLAEYDAMETQGKLLKIPCIVGDTVYEIGQGYIIPCTLELIWITADKEEAGNSVCMGRIGYDAEDCTHVTAEISCEDFGKTVFCTEGKAKQALGVGTEDGEEEEKDIHFFTKRQARILLLVLYGLPLLCLIFYIFHRVGVRLILALLTLLGYIMEVIIVSFYIFFFHLLTSEI